MMGFEPTTFCMATRPGVSPAAAWCRLIQGMGPESRSPGCRKRQRMAPRGSQTLANRLQNNWPCNSNSVCLVSCRLPGPGARSMDFELSAGILAAGPARQAYSP
jgi:hypothetical protein